LKNIVEFSDVAAAAKSISEQAMPGDLFLVKASRSMRLEQVTEALKNRMRSEKR